MAKAKIIYFYLFCIFICSSLTSQSDIIPLAPEGGTVITPSKEEVSTHTNQRECLREIYTSQIGVREYGGANRGAEVKSYLNAVGLDEGYPWCAAFVSWCFQQVEIPIPKSAWVPSYAIKDRMVYKQGKVLKRLPKYGDVMLIWFKQLKRPAHIGFIDKWGERWIVTVEGNTNEDGSREGDGVYRKRRLKRQIWAVTNFIDDESK